MALGSVSSILDRAMPVSRATVMLGGMGLARRRSLEGKTSGGADKKLANSGAWAEASSKAR